MKDLFITYRLSNKTGRPYLALVADLGYKELILTYDTRVIYELSPVPISELYSLEFNSKISIK